jgi:hypothetical protein
MIAACKHLKRSLLRAMTFNFLLDGKRKKLIFGLFRIVGSGLQMILDRLTVSPTSATNLKPGATQSKRKTTRF